MESGTMVLTFEFADQILLLPFKWNLFGSTFTWYYLFFHHLTKWNLNTLEVKGLRQMSGERMLKFQFDRCIIHHKLWATGWPMHCYEITSIFFFKRHNQMYIFHLGIALAFLFPIFLRIPFCSFSGLFSLFRLRFSHFWWFTIILKEKGMSCYWMSLINAYF